jgi:hypothetical protein
VTADDRRFYAVLFHMFGPLFIAGGWLAAFTLVGSALIRAGTGMLILSPLPLRSVRSLAAALGLVVLGWTWPGLVAAV